MAPRPAIRIDVREGHSYGGFVYLRVPYSPDVRDRVSAWLRDGYNYFGERPAARARDWAPERKEWRVPVELLEQLEMSLQADVTVDRYELTEMDEFAATVRQVKQ
jgi:hypothetical protein